MGLAAVHCRCTLELSQRREYAALLQSVAGGTIGTPQLATWEGRKAAAARIEASERKLRLLGSLQLIGELFVAGVLPSGLMFDTVEQLCPPTDGPAGECGRHAFEVDAECVMRLLAVCGARLDAEAGARLDHTLLRVARIAAHPGLTTRLRCGLEELLHRRQRGWTERGGAVVERPQRLADLRTGTAQ